MSLAAPLRPIATGERLVALDALRGFALWGVLLVNAFMSARPFATALAPPHGEPWSEIAAWTAFEGLLVMKFVALFSALFGMGLILQARRATERGADFAPVYRRRLGLLALLGLLHGCLLFEGDILLPYALVGGLLFLFRDRSPRTLALLGMIPLALGLALSLGWEIAGVDVLFGEGDPYEERIERARRDGPYSLLLTTRPLEYLAWLVISSLSSFNWRVVGLFFLGAAVMKAELLDARNARLHRRVAVLGWLVGGALEAAAVVISWADVDAGSPTGIAGVVAVELGSLLLSAGYAATLVLAVHAGRLRALQRGLAAVGRTALTNYLLQSVLMNLVFFTVGLGLYGRLSRIEVLSAFTGVFAVQILASVLWLRAFTMGPMEWLWRCLTYRRWARLRQKAAGGVS